MSGTSYRTQSIPVRGGALAIAEWGPQTGPVVLAIHGITASHLAWAEVAAALPGVRIVAPDLRGRGRSAELPPPYGLAQHAADGLAVLDALAIPAAIVVGHSMGAFVAAALATAAPARVARLVLVDGGLPLALPPGMDRAAAIEASLGAALARLSMTFPSREAYRAFWQAHPSFVGQWSPAVEAYADYDLIETPTGLRPPTPIAAVAADSAEFYGAPPELPADTVMLTAPRGLQNAAPLYTHAQLDAWATRLPALTITEVPDVNHYTIVMAPAGARAVAAEILRV